MAAGRGEEPLRRPLSRESTSSFSSFSCSSSSSRFSSSPSSAAAATAILRSFTSTPGIGLPTTPLALGPSRLWPRIIPASVMP